MILHSKQLRIAFEHFLVGLSTKKHFQVLYVVFSDEHFVCNRHHFFSFSYISFCKEAPYTIHFFNICLMNNPLLFCPFEEPKIALFS